MSGQTTKAGAYAPVSSAAVEIVSKSVQKGGESATIAKESTAAPDSSKADDKDGKDDKGDNMKEDDLKDAKGMTFFQLMKVLKPFFWPDEGAESAGVNRLRTTATWLAVFCSKGCSVAAPFFVLDATNQLADGDYESGWRNICIYGALLLGRSFFKEIQGALYVKILCVSVSVSVMCVCMRLCAGLDTLLPTINLTLSIIATHLLPLISRQLQTP